MKVLHITPYYKPAFEYGGPSRSIPLLCEALAQEGYEVTVFTTDACGNGRLNVSKGCATDVGGVSVYYFSRDWGARYFYSRSLAEACHQKIRDFDLVHISAVWTYPMVPACAACKRYRVPYIISPRTSFMRWALGRGRLKKALYFWLVERRNLRHAAAFHYTTEMEQRESEELGFCLPGFIVPNPVNLGEFDNLPTPGWLHSRLALAPDVPVILYLGRLEPRKGLDLTIQAMAILRNSHLGAHLVIAGPDERGYQAVLQGLVSRLGVMDLVHFVGYLGPKERLAALADATLFTLTSYAENFALAVVEAMASRVPVLVSDRVGIAPDISAAQAGLVVPLDPRGIATGMQEMLSMPESLRQMGINSQRLTHEQYNPKVVARAMVSNYDRILTVAGQS